MTKRWSPKYHRWYNDKYYWSNPKCEYRPSRRYTRSARWGRKYDAFDVIKRRLQWLRKIERMQQKSADEICPSGYTKSQGWSALFRAWTGFIARKREDDEEGMQQYALSIQKIEKDMGLSVYQFQDLKLAAVEYMNEPENQDLIEEKARELGKDPDELSSQEILSIMMEQDEKAYQLLNESDP